MRAYERLIKYTTFHTGSFEESKSCPSSSEQLVFARYLLDELKSLGVTDASCDENGYVMGTIPSNNGKSSTVMGFIAHMDTVSDVEFRNVKTRIVKSYGGGDIVLNEEKGIVMRGSEFPVLCDYIGDDLLVTDGTTILGADDKAGVAEIMTMVEILMKNSDIKHGEIKIGFTPDEEIGRGTDKFDVDAFGADFAYTVDGGAFGQIEYENFNASNARVTFCGKSVHPGDGKSGGMKNAMRIAMEFDSMLPEAERPEFTEGYEGFYHLIECKGCVENAELHYILRDHDATKLKIKKATFAMISDFLNTKYGKGTVKAEMFDSYANMAEKIMPHMHLIDNAVTAIEKCGGQPLIKPIRGGTDGARLSFMGLPCPNLGTGSENCHGRFEFASLQKMDKCVESLVEIVKLYADF